MFFLDETSTRTYSTDIPVCFSVPLIDSITVVCVSLYLSGTPTPVGPPCHPRCADRHEFGIVRHEEIGHSHRWQYGGRLVSVQRASCVTWDIVLFFSPLNSCTILVVSPLTHKVRRAQLSQMSVHRACHTTKVGARVRRVRHSLGSI